MEKKKSKKNLQIGVRIDEELSSRLALFESITGIPPSMLARTALEAAIDSFENEGHITFPLMVIPQEEWEKIYGKLPTPLEIRKEWEEANKPRK